MTVHCSIIIRSFNEERHIGRLLDGIARQVLPEGITAEIILVDSGSDDSTVSIASQMGATVHHISKETFSFGRALNLGCASAKGNILLFASAHVYPIYDDWIEQMLRPFSDPQVGLVYGRQVGNEVTRFSEHEVFERWFPSISNFDQKNPFCNNANCAVRKDLWEQQRYNELLTGLEDLDWANRIQEKGFKIVYTADAPIVHVHEETLAKIRNRYRREAIALKHIMPKVQFGLFDFIRLFTANAFSDICQAYKSGCLAKQFCGILAFRFMQFYGTYLGHRQKGAITSELKNRFYYPNDVFSRKKILRHASSRESKRIQYSSVRQS